MSLFNNPPTNEELALWITGTYMALDLVLTKVEKLLDHAYRIYDKYQKFRKKHDVPKLGQPSP